MMQNTPVPTAIPAMAGLGREPLLGSWFSEAGSTTMTGSLVNTVPFIPIAVPFSGVCLQPASSATRSGQRC